MPLTVTLADLRSAVRERSDTVNSARLTNAKLDRAINSSIRRLHNKVCALGEDEYTQPCTIITTAGQEWSLLPDDMLALRDVEWYPDGSVATSTVTLDVLSETVAGTTRLIVVENVDGLPECVPFDVTLAPESGPPYELGETETLTIIDVTYSPDFGWVLTTEAATTISYAEGFAVIIWSDDVFEPTGDPVAMERFMLQNRRRWLNDGGGWQDGTRDGRTIAYRLVNKNRDAMSDVVDSGSTTTHSRQRIYWAPIPQAQHGVRVWYIREPQTLTEATDAYDGRSGFEEWVILDAAIQIMNGEESDTRAVSGERDRVWADQIVPLFAKRDQARPSRVIDVEGSSLDWPHGRRWGRL